ncbi:hypothetical protein L208DRAFT_1279824 [Tricholoma matsutake]|nr:hypothetical protein L208DRAFT_1279824 [Tricholoma matsutake 945]
MFDRSFAHGELNSWTLTSVNDPSLDALNHYFMPIKDSLCLESIPFQENIDPHGVLAKMLAAPGVQCIHTEENEVEYCRGFRQLDGQYKYVFESCGPQTFRKGDIVEIQFSFMVVPIRPDPIKGKQCKMLVVLHCSNSTD